MSETENNNESIILAQFGRCVIDDLESIAPLDEFTFSFPGDDEIHETITTLVECPRCSQVVRCSLDAVADFCCPTCEYDVLTDNEELKPKPV